METNVTIKIFDSVNNLDFEIPISSEGNSPLSINKNLSDLTNLTGRSGVQSRKFKIPISKEIANNYNNFNQAQHYNSKDVDGDKEAAIIINGNEFERGKIRVTDFVSKAGFESIELLFFGNNFDWTELGKDLTMSDIDWTVNTFDFLPQSIKNTWTGSVDAGNEFVFPLENRGNRKLMSMIHSEDFRPSFYLHSVFTRFFQNIGYTISSDFINSADFKTLVLSYFGKRFSNSKALRDDNTAIINAPTVGEYQTGTFTTKEPANFSVNGALSWNDSIAPASDLNNLFNPNIGNIYAGTTYRAGRFTAAAGGYYKFNINYNLSYLGWASQSGEVDMKHFLVKYDSSGVITQSLAGVDMENMFIGTASQVLNSKTSDGNLVNHNGEVEIELGVGESVEVWRLTSANQMDYYDVNYFDYTVEMKMTNKIAEGTPLTFQGVLDDKVKVLSIINDVSRMFNLMFDTDPVLKNVRIEPRNTFYDEISEAIEITELIDISKPIKTSFNSDSHNRDMSFYYTIDGTDGYVKGRNDDEGTILARYDHSLPSKFKSGSTNVTTSNIAATYFIKDFDSVGVEYRTFAPMTSRFWKEFETNTPLEELIDHKPRILNYVYGRQQTYGSGTTYNEFRFYDEGFNRDYIPAVLTHRATTIGGDSIVLTPFNLQWHKRGGLDGLFGSYWSKTVTEIVEGISLELSIRINDKFWNDFNFKNVFYISEPVEIKGYWLIESLKGYQPENSNLCKAKLLHRVEFDKQTETATEFEEISVLGRYAPVEISEDTVMRITTTDANGDSISIPMEMTDETGTTKTIIA